MNQRSDLARLRCSSCALWLAVVAVVAWAGCGDSSTPSDGIAHVEAGGDSASDADAGNTDTTKADSTKADAYVLECNGMPAACCTLMKKYETALGTAKTCSAGAKTCTKSVAGDLPCQCKTIVDASKTAAIAQLDDLLKQWQAASCPMSSTCKCVDPKSGSCESLGGAMKCVDIL